MVALSVILVTFVRILMGQRKLRARGIDPMTAGPVAIHTVSEAAARAARSPVDRPPDLEGLRNQGLITADEYDAKRADILRSL